MFNIKCAILYQAVCHDTQQCVMAPRSSWRVGKSARVVRNQRTAAPGQVRVSRRARGKRATNVACRDVRGKNVQACGCCVVRRKNMLGK